MDTSVIVHYLLKPSANYGYPDNPPRTETCGKYTGCSALGVPNVRMLLAYVGHFEWKKNTVSLHARLSTLTSL